MPDPTTTTPSGSAAIGGTVCYPPSSAPRCRPAGAASPTRRHGSPSTVRPGPYAGAVLDDVPVWLHYLLWYDQHSRSWVIDYNAGQGQLLFYCENKTLTRAAQTTAAQQWAAAQCTEPATTDEDDGFLPILAWWNVSVLGRTGWVPLFDPDFERDAMFHALHPPYGGGITGCCTWRFHPRTSARATA
jgi:hypothetical protein